MSESLSKKARVDVGEASTQQHSLPPFAWPKTVEEIQACTKKVLEDAKANLRAVAGVSKATFSNVIKPLMLAPNYKTNHLVCQSKFLQHCSTDPKLRKAAEDAGIQFKQFKAQSRTDEGVFAKVMEFANSEEYNQLEAYEKHFVDALVADFKRGGLALGVEKRAELQSLLDADAKCCADYGSNLGNEKTRLRFMPEELAGLPQEFINDRLDGATGEVVISLKYPDVIPIGSQCEVAETRRKVMVTRETSYRNNLELVAEGIGYRKKIATLLGYKSWAHYVTETRMSGSPEVVNEFIDKIRKMAQQGFRADIEEIHTAKKKHLLELGEIKEDDDVQVEAWDISFYHNRILKGEYGVDNEAIRQYFPLDHVVQVTMDIYQQLLGLTFIEIPKGSFDSWHEEVRLFYVKDTGSGDQVGHFYLDLHPRDGKYGHAAIFHLLKCNGDQTPVDCMLCNLPAPSKDGNPALLLHSNVVTFFHEFGHIMHGLCAEGDGNSTRLAKCPRDFVEAPSQMLENWCWQDTVLKRLSKHHETGKSLDVTLLDSMIRAKNVHEALFMMRQIYLGTLDLQIHSEVPPKSAEELQALVDKIRPEISGVKNPPGANMLRNFGHLMNQYSAAYYGYLWAEVISADMFETRFKQDCMNPEAGMAYRKQVLAVGGTGKIMDHLTKFLGRKPEQAAFLRSRGMLESA